MSDIDTMDARRYIDILAYEAEHEDDDEDDDKPKPKGVVIQRKGTIDMVF